MSNYISSEFAITSLVLNKGAEPVVALGDRLSLDLFTDKNCVAVLTYCLREVEKGRYVDLEIMPPKLLNSVREVMTSDGAGASMAHLEHHIGILEDQMDRRRLDAAATLIKERINQDDIKGLESEVQEMLFSAKPRDGGEVNAHNSVMQTLANLEKQIADPSAIMGFDTGFKQINRLTQGQMKKKLWLITARPGDCKCCGPEVPVLMWDGSVKRHDELAIGDALVDKDGARCLITGIHRGIGDMFLVRQNKGIDYTCNSAHIIPIWCSTNKGKRWGKGPSEIVADEYADLPGRVKHAIKGLRTSAPIRLDGPTPDDIHPYLLGLWLGDGDSRQGAITNGDPEIGEWLLAHGAKKRKPNSSGCPSFGIPGFGPKLRLRGLRRNKHIPEDYMSANLECRKQLLAGLLDTDGHLPREGQIEITQKSRVLIDQIRRLAISLGGWCRIRYDVPGTIDGRVVGRYHHARIALPPGLLPMRVPRKRIRKSSYLLNHSGRLEVSPIGVGPFVGVEVDSPSRTYLLEDGTVTHNSLLAMMFADAAIKRSDAKVLILSLEMSHEEWTERWISHYAQVNLQDALVQKLPSQLHRIQEAASRVARLRYSVYDRSKLTKSGLVRQVRQAASKGFDYIILDHLGLMRLDGRDLRISYGEVTSELRSLAKSLDIHVTVLIQLNRKAEEAMERGETLRLRHLAEADGPAQDCDVCLMLDHDGAIHVAKNRKGRAGDTIETDRKLETYTIREAEIATPEEVGRARISSPPGASA